MKPLLSIVIPVYNVDAYIEKCVISCFKQNISDDLYEIILVHILLLLGSLDFI